MALEKRDPLPVGRYWIDVTNEHETLFETWTLHDGVYVLKSTPLEDSIATEAGTWYLFETKVPTPWGMAPTLGWPTIADASVQSKPDTADAPEVEQPTLEDFFGGIQSGASMLLLVLVAGYFLTKSK
jgi:hypothetical protein